jgi:hypothetical protein
VRFGGKGKFSSEQAARQEFDRHACSSADADTEQARRQAWDDGFARYSEGLRLSPGQGRGRGARGGHGRGARGGHGRGVTTSSDLLQTVTWSTSGTNSNVMLITFDIEHSGHGSYNSDVFQFGFLGVQYTLNSFYFIFILF